MISIIVPCYNCESTLELCVQSLLKQEGNYEIVLVDDGSVDQTPALCDKYASEHSNVKVVHQENKGLMVAWKRGVSECSGEYVTFSDSDDWVEGTLIQRTSAVVRQYEPDMIIYGMTVHRSNGKIVYSNNRIAEGLYTRRDIEEQILPTYFSDGSMESAAIIPSRCNKLYRKELLTSNFELLSDQLNVGEDDVTTFAAIFETQTLYHIADYYPYHYIRSDDSMMGNYNYAMVQKLNRAKEELEKVANAKDYSYKQQISQYYLDNVLVTVKKLLQRNDLDKTQKKREFVAIVNDASVQELWRQYECLYKGYNRPHKLFAYLVEKKCYTLLVTLVGIKK